MENGKEIVEQMMAGTFRQIRDNQVEAKSETGTNNARPQRFHDWRQIAEIIAEMKNARC